MGYMDSSSASIVIINAAPRAYAGPLRSAIANRHRAQARGREATLLVIALPPDAFGAERWYDMVWAVPTCEDPADNAPTDGMSAAAYWAAYEPPGWHVLDRIGHLPAPPVIPAVARAKDPDVDGFIAANPGWDRVYRDRAELEADLRGRELETARGDRSASAFDWAPLAERLCVVADSLTPPRLDPVDRLRIAGIRLARARQAVTDARHSLYALARNALAAGVPKTAIASAAGVSRPTLDAWLAELETPSSTTPAAATEPS